MHALEIHLPTSEVTVFGLPWQVGIPLIITFLAIRLILCVRIGLEEHAL